MVTIENVEVTITAEADDERLFQKLFKPAILRFWQEARTRERDEEEGRQERALMPPPRR